MNRTSRITAIAVAMGFMATFAAAQDYYVGGTAGTNDDWNNATASKWTADSGTTYVDADDLAGTYHLNGNTIRAGRIGTPLAGATGSGSSSTFGGGSLVIDSYAAGSGLASNTTFGTLFFELANTSATSGTPAYPVGPRGTATAIATVYGPDSVTKATYSSNLVTAATTGTEFRTIRASTGVATLTGTMTLNGVTRFDLPSGPNDVRVNINSTITGSGNMQFQGGSAGGLTNNSFVTWNINASLDAWTGDLITVAHKHTLSFGVSQDFYTTNPDLELRFNYGYSGTGVGNVASLGFLNLNADVSLASGKLVYYTGSTASPVQHILPDGVYTIAELNSIVSTGLSGGHSSALPFASTGAFNGNWNSTTPLVGIDVDAGEEGYKLYIGQAIPEPSTYAAIIGGLALIGVALRRRMKK